MKMTNRQVFTIIGGILVILGVLGIGLFQMNLSKEQEIQKEKAKLEAAEKLKKAEEARKKAEAERRGAEDAREKAEQAQRRRLESEREIQTEKRKIFEAQADLVAKVEQKKVEVKREIKKSNLVVNGDFNDFHWSVGWQKGIIDKLKGSLIAELIPSKDNPTDKLLHLLLKNKNKGWIEQTVNIPSGKTIKNLKLEMEFKLISDHPGGWMPKSVEAGVGVQFQNEAAQKICNVYYTSYEADPMEAIEGMPGAPKARRPSGDTCLYDLGTGFKRIREDLGEKYLDCSTYKEIEKVRKIVVVGYLENGDDRGQAELYMDNVRIYYDEPQ